MNLRSTKELLFATWADIAKGLSSPKRLELLDVLANGERSVDVLARETNLGVTNASAHLLALKRAHLVASRKQAQFVFYRLVDDGVVRLIGEIQSLARRSTNELEQVVQLYFESTDALAPIDAPELRRRLRAGDVTLIDVPPDAEYRAGHIAGALAVPLAHLGLRPPFDSQEPARGRVLPGSVLRARRGSSGAPEPPRCSRTLRSSQLRQSSPR